MRPTSLRKRLVFLMVILLIGCFYSVLIPEVSAWNNPGLLVSPSNRITPPGGTVTYNIQVQGSTPYPPEYVSLDYLSLAPGINPTISIVNSKPPFTSTMTVHVSSSTPIGTYSIDVEAKSKNQLGPIVTKQATVKITVIGITPVPTPLPSPAKTDWALSSPSLSPSSPGEGDPVTFRAVLRALSTTRPYPQSVKVIATLDGVPISGGSLNYPGPNGIAMIVSSTPPWTATEGVHTIVWEADPAPYAYNDPNRGNNEVSLTFSVSPKPQPFDFTLTAAQASQTIKTGETAAFTITANLISGTPTTVTLSVTGLPGGTVPTFNPDRGEPNFASTLRIDTAAVSAVGTYILTITGTGGGLTRTTTVELTLRSPEEPDFELSAVPPSQAATPPQQTSFIITVTGKGDFKSRVDLAISGLPSGVQAQFNPQGQEPDYTSSLTLNIGEKAPPGSYTLTIYASGGGKTRSTTLELIVHEESTSTPTQMETEISSGFRALTAQNNLLLWIALVIVIIALVTILIRRRRSK